MFICGDCLYKKIFLNVFFSDYEVTKMGNISLSDGPTTSRDKYSE